MGQHKWGTTGPGQGPVPAIYRAHVVLSVIASNPGSLSVVNISRESGIPRSTAHRIVSALEQVDYLQRVGNRYSLGQGLLRLAISRQERMDLRDIAHPIISRLAAQIGETVKLSSLSGDEVQVVDRVESKRQYRISVDVGARFPLHAGAASKAILAFLPRNERETLLPEELIRYTPKTITDRDHLERKLEEIRRSYISSDNGEYQSAIGAIACPVFRVGGQVVAAISVAFLSLDDTIDQSRREVMALEIKKAASEMSREIGGILPVDELKNQ